LDRYDRLVARVWLDDEDVALLQLQAGLAWHSTCHEWEQSRAERVRYAAAQKVAEESRVGLWSDRSAIPPWVSRGKPCAEQEQPGEFYDGHVVANRRSGKYFLPGCRGYSGIPPADRVRFDSERSAASAGFARSDGC
jgi:hypothetical protein